MYYFRSEFREGQSVGERFAARLESEIVRTISDGQAVNSDFVRNNNPQERKEDNERVRFTAKRSYDMRELSYAVQYLA